MLKLRYKGQDNVFCRQNYGRWKVYYMTKGYDDRHKLKFVNRNVFSAGCIAYGSVCYTGKTQTIVIPKGTKVNSDLYF